MSVTRAKGGGREGDLRTPRQARETVTKELSGEKHQAAREMTEHQAVRSLFQAPFWAQLVTPLAPQSDPKWKPKSFKFD